MTTRHCETYRGTEVCTRSFWIKGFHLETKALQVAGSVNTHEQEQPSKQKVMDMDVEENEVE